MSGPYRLKDMDGERFGRLLDRSTPMKFTFNGRALKGLSGDTVASALLANGVKTVSRSMKLHRPRGISGIGIEEPNAVVEIGDGDRRTPNLSTNQIALTDGLAVRSQNAWPGLAFDAAAPLNLARAALPAGFQYKLFKRPRKAWRLYERTLRKLANGGVAPAEPDPDRYEHVHLHADVLIAGGGLAGIAAAEAAAADGLSVVLAETSPRLGGIADAYDGKIGGVPLLDWVRDKVRELAALPNVHILTRTQVAGLYDHGFAMLVEKMAGAEPGPEAEHSPRERVWKLRVKSIVLATGAHEKPLVFPDNDRPGIMLATSARLFLRRYGIVPGKRIVIAASGDEAYRTASDFQAAGIEIARIVDLRLMPNGAMFHIAKSRRQPITIG